MNLKDINIKDLMSKLAKQNEVFESEAQFQFELAQLIKDEYGKYGFRIKLELVTAYSNNPLKRYYSDIIILDKDNNYIAIELKYKTKASNCNGVILLNHGATDLGRFDYLWDIHRIELLKYKNRKIYSYNDKLKEFIKGFAIILTNESKYWTINKKSKDTLYKNFCISDLDKIDKKINLEWNKKNGKSCVDGTWRDIQLSFKQDYAFKWDVFNNDFRYLIIEI